MLVVLKTTSKPSEKAQAIRVVDHGEQQKEALRRLYDAQVLLQSYEDQLHAKDEQLYKIQVCVKKAIRESSADYLREPELIESLGFSEEELHAEGITTEQKPTGKMARFEAMLDQSFENQKWEEKQERERRAKDLQANGSSLPAHEPQSDMQWFKVPYWIKADEETREMVQKIKQHFMDEMNAKGHFDHNAFLEHLWQCGFQVAQHWAGSPNEELVKQAEAAEKKARSVQREALQETSMLRQHIKRVERKYKELQSNAAKMQKAMSTMASQLKEARDTAAMFGVELPSSPSDTSNRRPSVLMSFGQQGRSQAPAGHLAVPGAKSERRMSVAGADGGFQVGGLPEMPAPTQHHGQGPGLVSPLHADDTLEIMADQMQLDEMDNEIFEPLNQFDDDLKDLMIDCITEKVRRILSLDPSKYKNGRLPFGLKPHKGIAFADDETDLEAELERMRELYERLKEENEQLLRQLEAARAAAERWKQKYLELQNKPAEVQEEKVVMSRPASVKTTPETPKATEPTPPPVIKGLSDEEVKRLLEEQEKAYKAKIAALEKRIKQLEDELAKLKAEKDKAEAKAKEAAETAQKERERRETLQKEQEQGTTPPEPAPSDAAALEEALAAQRRAEQLVAELRNQLSQWLSANRQTMEVALRGFTKLASITGHKVPQSELKFMQAFATAEPTPLEVLKAMKEASPKFEVWVSEALAKYAASFATDGTPAPPVEVPTKEPEAPVPEAKEVVYKGDPKEVQELKRITQRQQEEISKLLLTIDELRKRMENIKVVSLDAGPGVAGTVDNIMEKVGLKDIMEAGLARNPPVLKGVFERLYSDATQRIQRYGLIRQQMLLANKAYAAVVEAVASEEDQQWPDFERLNDTTDATIRGMWYHTEYLFRSACEYAMTQGVEATLVKAQQNLVSEFEEKVEESFSPAAPRREKPPGPPRRQERGIKEEASSRRELPSKRRPDEPTPFMSYMAALREVQGQLAKEVVQSVPEKRPTRANLDEYRTLKDACDRPKPIASPTSMTTSRSLPALPKTRGLGLHGGLQEPEAVPSPLTKAKMAATMMT